MMDTRKNLSLFLVCLLLLSPMLCQQQPHEQEQFQAFAQHLADFNPTESFEFDLAPSEQQTFIYWPPPTTTAFRGMFYITSEESGGLFVGFEYGDVLRKTFWDKRIGVFNVQYGGVGDMKIIVKSEIKHLRVYLSYEIVGQKKKQQNIQSPTNQTQSSQLSRLLSQFTTIRNSLTGQQQILKSIIYSTVRQGENLRQEIQSKTWRVIIETVVLIGSGVVSLWLLRKEYYKGYELIV